MLTRKLIESLMTVAEESDAGMASVIIGRDEGDDKCQALFYITGKGAMDRIRAIEGALDEVSDQWEEEALGPITPVTRDDLLKGWSAERYIGPCGFPTELDSCDVLVEGGALCNEHAQIRAEG